MKNKVYIFMSKSADGTIHNYGKTSNKLLVHTWYLLNKKSQDKAYYVVDDTGFIYPTCPVGAFSQRALRNYLKSNSSAVDDILKKGVKETCEKNQ